MSPQYNTLNPPTALYPGDIGLAFSSEVVNTGELSQQFAIAPYQGNSAGALSVEVAFSAAPGNYKLQIFESDTDNIADYVEVPIGGDITGVSNNNVARVDLSPFLGGFVAIYVQTQPANNPVNVTAKIIRKV